MTTEAAVNNKPASLKRLMVSVAIIFGIWLVSTLIYNNAWRFFDASTHRPLAMVSAILMMITIAYGALIIYPIAFFQGVSLTIRVLACFVTPFFWLLKELVMLPDFYSLGETLYYAFIPLFFGVASSIVIEMGLAELACRLVVRRKNPGDARQVISTGPVFSIIAGSTALYIFVIWDEGVGFWYIYQSVYQLLFLS